MLSWLALVALLATPFAWRLRVGSVRVGSRALFLPLLALILFAVGRRPYRIPGPLGFNLAGGTQVPPELAALWVGLSVYATAFIAEIVRGSIEGHIEGADRGGSRTRLEGLATPLP